jgi:3-deoxy-7-phosphoheptulonate synthase
VLLKRGMASTIEEFLLAAEYVMSEGNYQVILCERGVRTFAAHTRFTLDLSIVPAVQRISHLPVIVDPSHSTGKREKVIPLARAGVASELTASSLMSIRIRRGRSAMDRQALLFNMFQDRLPR